MVKGLGVRLAEGLVMDTDKIMKAPPKKKQDWTEIISESIIDGFRLAGAALFIGFALLGAFSLFKDTLDYISGWPRVW